MSSVRGDCASSVRGRYAPDLFSIKSPSGQLARDSIVDSLADAWVTVTNATAWGAESDNNRSQASYYDLVTDARIAPKEAWSNLNPSAGPSRESRLR